MSEGDETSALSEHISLQGAQVVGFMTAASWLEEAQKSREDAWEVVVVCETCKDMSGLEAVQALGRQASRTGLSPTPVLWWI